MQSTHVLRHLDDIVWVIDHSAKGYYGYAWNPKDGKGILMTAPACSAELAQESLKHRLCELLEVSSSETLRSATGALL